MALVKCKDCGNEVSTSAAACPKCGAPVVVATPVRAAAPASKRTKVLGAIAALLFVVFAIVTRNDKNTGVANLVHAATPEPAPAPAMDVDLARMLGAYKANELAADGQYKDRIITTAGIVDEIGKTLGSPSLKLGTGAGFEIPGLRCFLTEDQIGRASQLAKGQKVIVVGKVSGLVMDVVVNDCRIQ